MIAIKGMKMPKSCESCDLITDTYEGGPDDLCILLQKTIFGDRRRNDCPLVEVEEPGWVKRLREEYEDLKVKRKKLCDYYDSVCGTASTPELVRLIDQESVMEKYMKILEKRAEIKGYTLEVKGEGEE